MKAHEVLDKASTHMKDREKTYDSPGGERSIPKAVAMFKALTGHDLTNEQGWLFMCCLKMVRMQQGDFRADNYEDLAAYAGLACEQAFQDRQYKTLKTETFHVPFCREVNSDGILRYPHHMNDKGEIVTTEFSGKELRETDFLTREEVEYLVNSGACK